MRVRNSLLLLMACFLAGCGSPSPDTGIEVVTSGPDDSLAEVPTPQPTPDFSSIFETIAPVAQGQGVSEAAVYNPADVLSHQLVLIDPGGQPHEWNDVLPAYWRPSAVGDIDLVIMVDRREDCFDSQTYSGDTTVYRCRIEILGDIREARTGQILDTFLLQGSEPADFPVSIPEGTTKIFGSNLYYEDLETYLACSNHIGLCPRFVQTLEGHTEFADKVVYSPDGRILASMSHDHTIRLWEFPGGRILQTLNGHTEWVTDIAFSPDGLVLASGSVDRTVRIWRVADGALLHSLEGHSRRVEELAFSPDGQILATGSSDATARLWRVADGALLHTLEGHDSEVYSVAFSPDGQILATGSSDATVRLWRVADGALLHTLEGHVGWVESILFSPDGETLASSSAHARLDDATVCLWRVADGALLSTLTGHSLPKDGTEDVSIAFSPDGQILASGSGQATIRLWRAADGTLLRILNEEETCWVRFLDFSPDGRILASTCYSSINLWRIPDGKLIVDLDVGSIDPYGTDISFPESPTFSPDGEFLAAGSSTGDVLVWQLDRK